MYLYSGAIGGVLWLLFTWRQQALCVGASGSLFSVLAVAALAFPDLRLALLFPPVALPMRTFVFIMVLSRFEFICSDHQVLRIWLMLAVFWAGLST